MSNRAAGRPTKDSTSADQWVQVRVTKDRKEKWKISAGKHGLKLSQFVTLAADANCPLDPSPAAVDTAA